MLQPSKSPWVLLEEAQVLMQQGWWVVVEPIRLEKRKKFGRNRRLCFVFLASSDVQFMFCSSFIANTSSSYVFLVQKSVTGEKKTGSKRSVGGGEVGGIKNVVGVSRRGRGCCKAHGGGEACYSGC